MVAHGVSRGWILGIQPVAEFARIRKSIARSEFLRIRLQTQKNTTSEALTLRGGAFTTSESFGGDDTQGDSLMIQAEANVATYRDGAFSERSRGFQHPAIHQIHLFRSSHILTSCVKTP